MQGECEPQGLAQEQCRACCRVSPAAFLMHHCDVPFRAVQPQQPQMFGEELPDMREGERPSPARRKRQPSMSETMPLYTLCREDLESMDKEVRAVATGLRLLAQVCLSSPERPGLTVPSSCTQRWPARAPRQLGLGTGHGVSPLHPTLDLMALSGEASHRCGEAWVPLAPVGRARMPWGQTGTSCWKSRAPLRPGLPLAAQ